eukprot:2392912-Pyramimonas_sp.AAC.1
MSRLTSGPGATAIDIGDSERSSENILEAARPNARPLFHPIRCEAVCRARRSPAVLSTRPCSPVPDCIIVSSP